MDRQPEFVTLADAAERCNVSVRTVRRWIDSGHLRAYRVGPRTIRVVIEDLDNLFRPIPSPLPR